MVLTVTREQLQLHLSAMMTSFDERETPELTFPSDDDALNILVRRTAVGSSYLMLGKSTTST
jgi:hypothetical protein